MGELITNKEVLTSENNKLKQGTSITNLESDMAELKEQICHISRNTKEIAGCINLTPSNTSWAKIVKNMTTVNNGKAATIPEIILEETAAKHREDNEKEKRAANVVIYNLPESNTNKEADLNFVKSIVVDTGTNAEIKKVIRLGKQTDNCNKIRPALITLDSSEKRKQLLANLKNLKGNEKYRGISITMDLTPEERRFIKQKSVLARQMNEKLKQDGTNDAKYVVRGDRETSWDIKLIKLKVPSESTTTLNESQHSSQS